MSPSCETRVTVTKRFDFSIYKWNYKAIYYKVGKTQQVVVICHFKAANEYSAHKIVI